MKKNIIIILGCLLTLFTTKGYAQNIDITGTVLDEFNEGLPGASVSVKGTTQGTVTDLDGKFSIKVPNSKSVLIVSFIGYQTQEVVVGNQRSIQIKMKDDSKMIDEVVIVGFGTQKKINATGAVKTMDNAVLEARPVANAIQGLQGTVAGLNITNDAGGGLGQNSNWLRQAYISFIVNGQSSFTSFSSYKNHTKRCTRAINRSRSRIFQHRKTFDIIWINSGKITFHAINQNQRFCIRTITNRTDTTNINIHFLS